MIFWDNYRYSGPRSTDSTTSEHFPVLLCYESPLSVGNDPNDSNHCERSWIRRKTDVQSTAQAIIHPHPRSIMRNIFGELLQKAFSARIRAAPAGIGIRMSPIWIAAWFSIIEPTICTTLKNMRDLSLRTHDSQSLHRWKRNSICCCLASVYFDLLSVHLTQFPDFKNSEIGGGILIPNCGGSWFQTVGNPPPSPEWRRA